MLRFTTLAAILIAAAHPALAATPVEHGEGDGERFEYTTVLKSNGFIHIAGVVLGSRQQFELDVAPSGHVDGTFGDTPVEYNVGKRVRDKVLSELDEARAVAVAALPN